MRMRIRAGMQYTYAYMNTNIERSFCESNVDLRKAEFQSELGNAEVGEDLKRRGAGYVARKPKWWKTLAGRRGTKGQ